MNLTEIITSDIVPLAERGLFQGLIGFVWALACGIGPPIVRTSYIETINVVYMRVFQGGAFAQRATWRWLFCKSQDGGV